MRIGAIIKQRREAFGWTQTELAERTGNVVTQAMVSKIEAGEDNVKIDTLRGFARAFGCSVVDLLPEEDRRRASVKARSGQKPGRASGDRKDSI